MWTGALTIMPPTLSLRQCQCDYWVTFAPILEAATLTRKKKKSNRNRLFLPHTAKKRAFDVAGTAQSYCTVDGGARAIPG